MIIDTMTSAEGIPVSTVQSSILSPCERSEQGTVWFGTSHGGRETPKKKSILAFACTTPLTGNHEKEYLPSPRLVVWRDKLGTVPQVTHSEKPVVMSAVECETPLTRRKQVGLWRGTRTNSSFAHPLHFACVKTSRPKPWQDPNFAVGDLTVERPSPPINKYVCIRICSSFRS